MKTKLTALIAEQKALTAKIEEMINAIEYCEFKPEVLSTTEESSTLDPKKVFIKGHPTRGAEVIKMLEDLGGWNVCDYEGVHYNQGYFITDKGYINSSSLGYFKDFTELHLPEEVSAENSQTTDIKVGDWIWVDKIKGYCIARSEIYATNPHQVQHITNYQKWISNHHFVDESLGDKFHKVDPPKEDVELIEGEVYSWLNCSVMIYLKNDKSICYDCDHVAGVYMTPELTIRRNISDYTLATQGDRNFIFDALEKAGKHFDKEKMQLLDVEEWSLVNNEPTPMLVWEEDKWVVSIFDGVLTDDNSTCKNGIYDDIGIPYNDQTKNLVGTADSPDKYYKYVDK